MKNQSDLDVIDWDDSSNLVTIQRHTYAYDGVSDLHVIHEYGFTYQVFDVLFLQNRPCGCTTFSCYRSRSAINFLLFLFLLFLSLLLLSCINCCLFSRYRYLLLTAKALTHDNDNGYYNLNNAVSYLWWQKIWNTVCTSSVLWSNKKRSIYYC